MAKTIFAREFRNQISRILRDAQRGDRLIVTVHGRPTAEVGPLAGERLFELAAIVGIGLGAGA